MPPNLNVEAEAGGSGDQTRKALVAAGLHLFGVKGFEATSTREIAALAKANIASIAYHFGGKDGLRLACGEMIMERLREVAGNLIMANDPGGDPRRAQELFEAAMMAMAEFMIGHSEARGIAAFMLRELGAPGPVVDKLYGELLLPVHRKLCSLLGLATGQDPESDLIRLGTFSIAGQIVYFRIGRVVVARRMGWEGLGPDEVARIKTIILGNVRSFVAANRIPAP